MGETGETQKSRRITAGVATLVAESGQMEETDTGEKTAQETGTCNRND